MLISDLKRNDKSKDNATIILMNEAHEYRIDSNIIEIIRNIAPCISNKACVLDFK